jgi:hypothetical protein
MCITEMNLVNRVISNYLGLAPYGKHGIEMQDQGRKIAVSVNNKSGHGPSQIDTFARQRLTKLGITCGNLQFSPS